MTETTSLNIEDSIAIIGMNGRFPGAKNINEFWDNLKNGRESITQFSDRELLELGIDSNIINNPNYVKAGAFLEDIDLFDADFFGYNPQEAASIDPQHRIFLECAYSALETAGYNPERYAGKIGVFAGVGWNNYLLFNLNPDEDFFKTALGYQTVIGNDKDFLTTRISYLLNLKGISLDIQTACSTSLVATSMACQSLLTYQSDMALAGGISLASLKKMGYLYQEGGILSPDGHCRAFDAEAKGTIPGSGVGVVVLKRLEDALADGDTINAIIRGSAINNDGSEKIGYTAPSINGQAEVIAEALALAEVEPDTISYIETHGTGTTLGDPIEIAALERVFRDTTDKKDYCALGSVKTNIGHLDAAAGVTGLIKTVLALKHKQIPPSLHFEQPNPKIDFANSPFYVNTSLREWKTPGYPRRAGVSSFGIGGTNAHVVLEEAPDPVGANGDSPLQNLLIVSAKTENALETATDNLVEHLNNHPELDLADVAHTLQVGRKEFNYRRVVVGEDLAEIAIALSTRQPEKVLTNIAQQHKQSIVFMFPGQGSQYANMGKELYETEPVFREWIDRCSELLKPELELDLRSLIYPDDEQLNIATDKLKQTHIAQPAIFVVEYALAQLWMSWGIQPQAAIGHSIGEYVAATIAGVFSIEDALSFVAIRGRIMQQMPKGSMLAVSLPEVEVKELLNEELSLAASNAPNLCVISGSNEALIKIAEELNDKGVECRHLHTSHAFHSHLMNNAIAPLQQELSKIKLNSPQIPFISNVTGTWIATEEATDPDYWAKHMRETVRFAAGVAKLLQDKDLTLLEVGAGRTLSTLVKRNSTLAEQIVLSSLRHPKDKVCDRSFILNMLGRLWLSGIVINWESFSGDQQYRRVPLPTYPFERERYWVEPNQNAVVTNKQLTSDRALDVTDWFYVPQWKESIPFKLLPQEQQLESKLCWLVFVDTCEVGAKIEKKLKQQNRDVITVQIGDNFARLDDCSYTINPQHRGDYDALLEALQEQSWTPQKIIHCWNITSNDGLSSWKEKEAIQLRSRYQFFEDCQNLGFYSLLFLTQALAKQNITEAVELFVTTNNLFDVTGIEDLSPEKATILGACKVIPQEYPNITCCCLDIALSQNKTRSLEELIDYLLAEFTAQPTDNIVAYRGVRRWVQTYEPIRLEKRDTTTSTKLKQEGVYLITGGLGKVGFVLAEYIAKTVRAKLILLGRQELPDSDLASEWLSTHNPENPISEKIRKVRQLEALGAEVLTLSADVANETEMERALAMATAKFGAINGVIYAAGKGDGCTIMDTSKSKAEEQFQSKVYGLLVLEKLLRDRQLDFCQLTSSLASVLGGLGLISYSAANIFMDAFVGDLRQHSQRHCNKTSSFTWSSFNWDEWVTEEKSPDEDDRISKSGYRYGMTSKAKSISAFERLLSTSNFSQVVISSGNLQARIEEWIKPKSRSAAKSSQQKSSISKHKRSNIGKEYVFPRNNTEILIANIWQEVLGFDQIGIHENFFELGGHSLLAVQVASRIREVFNLDLPLQTFLFDAPSIAQLADLVEAQSSSIEEMGEIGEMEQLLAEIESLSPEAIRQELAEKSLEN